MSNTIFVIVEHIKGQIEDITFEMLGKAKEISGQSGGETVAILLGNQMNDVISQLGAADKVIHVDDPTFAEFNPEAYCKTINAIVEEGGPDIILVGNTSQGMDLAAGLSVDLNLPLVAYASNLTTDIVTSQLYGGKLNVESSLEGASFIAAIIPGSFSAEAGKVTGIPSVSEFTAPELSDLKVQFIKLIEPEGGDVDITQQQVLVSVGRGIQNEDNISIVQALADKLGGALSSSRPIVDNKWLPKTRQVGKSGLKVKPKLYIAVGISGAPEHVEGMKDAECIVAINTDKDAPIFDYAHYGVTEDLFDIIPALTEKL